MPDHLHLFCAPRELRFTIETWIAYWKREFSLKHKRADWKFQSLGWHHRLRDGENYSEKWLYVQENPLRKGLATRIEDWPFKGKVFDLIWSGKERLARTLAPPSVQIPRLDLFTFCHIMICSIYGIEP